MAAARSPANTAESTVPVPAGCLDIEMAAERSWSENYSGTDPFMLT